MHTELIALTYSPTDLQSAMAIWPKQERFPDVTCVERLVGAPQQKLARLGHDAGARFLTLDSDVTAKMWLCRDYLPEIVEHDRKAFPSIAHLHGVLPGLQVEVVPLPADCTDGFCVALWSRPEMHLDPDVRRASLI